MKLSKVIWIAFVLSILMTSMQLPTKADKQDVVQVCKMLVVAEKEFYSTPHMGDNSTYAQRFISDHGQKGLFTSGGADEDESAIGFSLAFAGIDTPPASGSSKPVPFDGYFYRILTGQGKNAPGGAKSYIVDGKMSLGFGFVAYPAEYPKSGVMSFIVNRDGVVYQKDLGPQTVTLAQDLNLYDPDPTWQEAEPDSVRFSRVDP